MFSAGAYLSIAGFALAVYLREIGTGALLVLGGFVLGIIGLARLFGDNRDM